MSAPARLAPWALRSAWGALETQLPAARRALSYIPEPGDGPLYTEQLAAPHHVRQVSVLQLDNLVRQHSLPRLVDSAAFLTSQLPARLENHVARLRALAPAGGPADLAALLTESADAKASVLEVSRDWGLLDTADVKGLQHFESHLAGFKERVEGEMARLMAGAQELAQSPGWWQRGRDAGTLNAALDLTHWYVLGLRLMLTQHSVALHQLVSGGGGSGSGGSGGGGGGGGETAAAAALATHNHNPWERGAPSARAPVTMVDRRAPLRLLLQHVCEDVRAFCVEKNSAAPDVDVIGGEGLEVPLVVPYFDFMVSEVLKNALQAVVNRYGAWQVDEADPVRVEISEPTDDDKHVLVSITDRGLGVPKDHFEHMFDWFWSSSSNKARSLLGGYGYSRDHGSQMHGLGAGVPVARVLAHFMGGSAHWETSPFELHTTVEIRLPKHGFVF